MQGVQRIPLHTCARCSRARARLAGPPPSKHIRYESSESVSPPKPAGNGAPGAPGQEEEGGAFSRRLAQMSEESLESGGRSAQKAVEEAGFSEDLKRRLQEKIANANSSSFRSEHAGAFAQADLPSSAGRATRDIAAASPWTGSESMVDASNRMLQDSYKPLRVPQKLPGIRGPPSKIDTGRPSNKEGAGTRLANARDKSSVYSYMKDPNMSEKEREKLRQEMKARFQPAGRIAPGTIQGLASLANERIEDAIARGQFKNIPRGKMIERDHTASNPFLDTTEYFMNKMIQKQDIVPPWIEKQQEVVSTASKFRQRLRNDWRRHVARNIASKGGSLQKQMALATEYAFAEMRSNPPKKKFDHVNIVDDGGQVSQITLSGELKAATEETTSDMDTEIKISEQAMDDDGNLKPPGEEVTVVAEQPVATPAPPTHRIPTVPPFRDPQWEKTEFAYLKAAVDNLNNLTRSYNLMAPDLAKKPYFSLDRELRSCFADVAPTVSEAIRQRALAPKIKGIEIVGHTKGGVLEKFAMDQASHVYDERKPQYGFKQFWRDLFAPRS